jgi:hypothetical protein
MRHRSATISRLCRYRDRRHRYRGINDLDDFDFFFDAHAPGQSSNNASTTLSSSGSAAFQNQFKAQHQHQQAGTEVAAAVAHILISVLLDASNKLDIYLSICVHDDLYASSSDWVDMTNCSSSNSTTSTSLSPFSNASSPSGMSVSSIDRAPNDTIF